MKPGVLHHCLARLLPHVDDTRIALTGSVAIGLHAGATSGDRGSAVAADDVDFVLESVDAVRQTVTSEFLVSHYHLPQPACAKFLVQLVDPVSRLRLDFFPDTLRARSRAPIVDVAGFPLRLLTAADILDHKLQLLSSASAASPVEEKHYKDARCLGAICGRAVPTVASSHLVSTTYSHDLDATCPRCQISARAAFPLAPKRAIFEVLGYV